MYRDWDILVGDLREEDDKNSSKSDFDNHSNAENNDMNNNPDDCKI